MILAYGVAIVHAIGVLLLMFFSVWVWFHPEYSGYFLISLVLLLATWPFFRGCPLTRLENWCRRRVSPEVTYSGQCLVYYGHKLGVNVPRRTPLAVMAGVILNAVVLDTVTFLAPEIGVFCYA